MNTVERVIELLVDRFGVRPEEVTLDKPVDSLGLDSLPAIAFLGEVETEFNVTLPQVLKPGSTVRDLAKEIDNRK